jgi:hypothetical protein
MITSPSNVDGTNDFTNSSRDSRTPPWLHHAGPTTVVGHGLSHLLGNLRTCSSYWLPSGASPSCRRLSDEWMDGSPS